MSKYSVKKPITVLMCALIIIVLGVFSYSRMSLSLFPDVNLPYVVVVTTYVGANPEEVESKVTNKVETSVSTISNFDNVASTSSEHYSMSIVTFADGTNMDTAFIDIREALDTISFDEGISSPMIMRISADMLPVMSFTISRDYGSDVTDEEALILTTKWLEEEATNKIKQVAGVADVSFTGTSDTVIKVNRNDLATSLNITDTDIFNVIEKNNFSGLVGFSLTDDGYMMLYLGNTKEGLEQLNEISIYYDKENDKIYKFKDLATVTLINSNKQSYSKINGKLGIIASIQKQSDSGITDVVNGVNKALENLNKDSDYPVNYNTIFSQGEYIDLAINTIIENIIIGGVLAIIILLIFLRKVKPTLIVAISMPISIISTFVLMYFAGINLNIVSMGGLALGLGMLVDNSIVVIENIFRMLNEGKSKKEAAIYGTKGVSAAIAASTFTTIAVFVPIMFLEGMIAEVFIQLALTVCFSLLASLFVAITLVPSISSRLLSEKNSNEVKKTKIEIKTEKIYNKILKFSLNNKILIISIILVLFIGSALLAISKGFSMMPKTDEGSISVTITLDPKTEFDASRIVADETTNEILKMKDIDLVSTTIGSSGLLSGLMGSSTSNTINYSISLKNDRSMSTTKNKEIITNIFSDYDYEVSVNEELVKVKVEEVEIEASSSLNYTFGSSGLKVVISGNDLQDMQKLSSKLTEMIAKVEGVEKVSDNVKIGDKQLRINIDYDQALINGVTAKDVQESINMFYSSLGVSNIVTTDSGLFYTIDGVNYEFLVDASSMTSMSMPYTDFLSLISIYDEKMLVALNDLIEKGINPYALNSPISIDSLNLPSIFTPTLLPKQIIVNPSLEYRVVNGIYEFKEAKYNETSLPYQGMILKYKIYYPDEGYELLSSAGNGFIYSTNEKNITNITLEEGFATINTNGKYRTITISGSFKDGVNTTNVSNEVNEKVNEYINSTEFKKEYNSINVSIEGENETTMDAVNDLILCCLIGILLVYMVMAIQFQSLLYPLIVLSVIPLSFTGGFLACVICGFELSIVAIIGLIVLVGIVVNNGIVLIDYINQLISEGLKIKEAILKAGIVRLRPILMTSLTTIFGVLPLALGLGQGSEIIQPMAAVVVGGLVFSTILTLIVIPVIYALFNKKKIKKESEEVID